MIIKEIRLTDEEHRLAIAEYLAHQGINVVVTGIDINKYVDKNYPVGVECSAMFHGTVTSKMSGCEEQVQAFPQDDPHFEPNRLTEPNELTTLSATGPSGGTP